MPRLTSRDYLTHRQFLRQEWDERDGAAFADLPHQQQLDLHDYFAPPVSFTDREALMHRSEMTKAFPSLPQKAGRAYEALRGAVDSTPNQIFDTRRDMTTTMEMIAGKRRSLRIIGVARPSVGKAEGTTDRASAQPESGSLCLGRGVLSVSCDSRTRASRQR